MFALLSGSWVRSVFMRFLRSSVCITREHAQTHVVLRVLSEGAGRDWASARRGARSALAPPIICGSVISPVRENTPVPAISPVWDFAPLPTIFGVSPRRPLAGPALAPVLAGSPIACAIAVAETESPVASGVSCNRTGMPTATTREHPLSTEGR